MDILNKDIVKAKGYSKIIKIKKTESKLLGKYWNKNRDKKKEKA